MPQPHDHYPDCPEPFIVSLARNGDRMAFEELVRRRQSSIRKLMRRCCSDASLADDLAQQVFLKVWLNLPKLREAKAFAGWLKRLAITEWLQHLRKSDALRDSEEYVETGAAIEASTSVKASSSVIDSTGIGMDLDQALATLPETARLCVVLAYQEGYSHPEIAELTELPVGTVKSHIKRGSEKLKQLLAAYEGNAAVEKSS